MKNLETPAKTGRVGSKKSSLFILGSACWWLHEVVTLLVPSLQLPPRWPPTSDKKTTDGGVRTTDALSRRRQE